MIRCLLSLLPMLLLSGRWARITAVTPYRWRYQAAIWRSAVKAAAGSEEQELPRLPQAEQARFWLARLQETPQVVTRAEPTLGLRGSFSPIDARWRGQRPDGRYKQPPYKSAVQRPAIAGDEQSEFAKVVPTSPAA